MLYTTLNLLNQHNPCPSRLKVLLTALGDDRHDGDKLIPLSFILKSNGLDDALWALRATTEPCGREARLLACQFAEGKDGNILALYEAKYPGDSRVRDCIMVARRYALGEATLQELQAAAGAAAGAARAAAWAARAAAEAAWAARAAAWATGAAAWAAWATAGAAAGAARAAGEQEWQREKLLEMLQRPAVAACPPYLGAIARRD